MSAPPRSKRGGLGKYLRARGRRGGGRPAEFGKRLVLEDEQEEEENDDENTSGDEGKYAKRELSTNAHRYEEPAVDPLAEEEQEPEVDLTSFLARQRLGTLEDDTTNSDDDIDHTLNNLPSTSSHAPNTRKNKAQTIVWDASMDELKRDKEAAEAVRDLKSRFRQNQPRLTVASHAASRQKQRTALPPSIPLPLTAVRLSLPKNPDTKVEDARHLQQSSEPNSSEMTSASKLEMEDFLDDLLS